MTDLEELILKGESDRLEFKKKINHLNKIARTLTSFANARGGIILVGVMDNGKICGIDPEEEKYNLAKAAEFYCQPPVKLIFEEIEHDNDLIVLKTVVPESNHKPHLAKINENEWRGYVRVKDESVQTSPLVLKAIKAEDGIKTAPAPILNKQESMLLLHLQKQPRITLPQFMDLANISKRRASRLLVGLVLQGLIRMHDKEKEPFYTLS